MKRDREDDPPQTRVPSLASGCIFDAFDCLPLASKRELIPKLLKSSRIVHGLFVDPVESKFRKWLCKGKKKSFTEEEVEKLWQIWTCVKIIACHAHVEFDEIRNQFSHGINTHDFKFPDDECGRFEIDCFDQDHTTGRRKNRSTGEYINEEEVKLLSREEYFDWILENTVPEQIYLDENEQGWNYHFPDVVCCWDLCECNMDPDEMKKNHNWDVDQKCPRNLA